MVEPVYERLCENGRNMTLRSLIRDKATVEEESIIRRRGEMNILLNCAKQKHTMDENHGEKNDVVRFLNFKT